MKCASLLTAIIIATTLAIPTVMLAQTPTSNSPTAPVTGMKPDRTTAPSGVRETMKNRETMKRQKRAQCRAQAKAEKVSLLKRPAYVKTCVARSS
jgi:hypothetical protein